MVQILQLFLLVSDDFCLDMIDVIPFSMLIKLLLQTMTTGLGGFVACRALSQKNGDPTRASRPWDAVLYQLSCFLFSWIYFLPKWNCKSFN